MLPPGIDAPGLREKIDDLLPEEHARRISVDREAAGYFMGAALIAGGIGWVFPPAGLVAFGLCLVLYVINWSGGES